MAKTYVTKNGGGDTNYNSSTVASGNPIMLLNKGPTLGYQYDYSGVVSGNVLYVVNNGPTLGIQHSTT